MHLRPGTRRQADQSNFVALLRQGLGTHLHILPDGAEIGRQPVGDDDDAALLRQIERALLQQLHHAAAPGFAALAIEL